MKRSIVLLISLFFILSLSVLIIKNLDDTNSYLKEKNHKINMIQIITSIKNLQSEITRIIQNNKDYINTLLDNENTSYMPIKVNEINILFLIKKYDKVDINTLKEDEKKYKEIKNLFFRNNISNFETFKDIYKNNEIEFENNKQVYDIIEKFIKKTYNNKIIDIKNKIGFIKKESDVQLYELFIKIYFSDEFAKAYYILNDKGEVKYFESSFK